MQVCDPDSRPASHPPNAHDLAGIHPKILSERLVHAKVSITMDVYSHAVPSLQTEAPDKLAALVYGER